MVRRAKPPRPISTRTRATVAKATLRAAKEAAERGQCDAAEMLAMRAAADLPMIMRKVGSPRGMVKALGLGVDAAEAHEAVIACRARKAEAER